MARRAIAIDILIASPGDVHKERDIVEQCILQWNAIHSRATGVVLTPRRWERDATPDLRLSAQERINKEIVRNSDILIGVFWSRLGTATNKARSGTEEEILEFVEAKKRCLLYFSISELPNDCDLRQIEELRKFKSEMNRRGLVSNFSDPEDLFKKVSAHVARAVQEEIVDKFARRELSLSGIAGSKNLSASVAEWQQAFSVHRGSYLMYSFLQTDLSGGKILTSTDKLDVCVSLLNVFKFTEEGIIFELFNPQIRAGSYEYYTYRGLALPAGNRFLYFFGDQVGAVYELFCAVTEYVTVRPPLYVIGHAIVVGVNPERSEFRPGSTGFLLKYYSSAKQSIKKMIGKEIGIFPESVIDESILQRMPRLYYRR